MATVNERLLDEAIHHAIDLSRYANGVVRRMIATLNRLDAELVDAITRALLKMPEGGFSIDRLEALLGSAREINAAAIRQVFGELPGELQALSAYESDYQAQALPAAFPRDARALIQFQRISPEQVYAAALARPFQGGLLRNWQTSIEAGRMKMVRDAIRQGFVQGQTVDQIVRRVRGTKAKQYGDGILQRSRREVESVVRTAVSHTAEIARNETYKANGDLVKALKWVATLDSRTSPMCRIRDQKQYSVEEPHKPIGHSIPWGAGPGRLHWCCRSCSAPVTKSWRELGIDMDELEPSTRASMDGQVAAETTYGQWLKRQSAARQDEILGPARGALLRRGGVAMEEMFSNRGEMLTLDQLRAKNARAFIEAGLDATVVPPRGAPRDAIAAFLGNPQAQDALMAKMFRGPDNLTRVKERLQGIAEAEGWRARPVDLAAINHYTGNSYAEINKRMREGRGTLEDRQFTALASRGVEDLPDEKRTVWRAPARRADYADRLWERSQPGADLDLGNQLMSFSISRDVADAWRAGVNLLLKVQEPRVGAYIEPISQNPGELEVLFPAGVRYVVAAKSEEIIGGKPVRVITLRIES